MPLVVTWAQTLTQTPAAAGHRQSPQQPPWAKISCWSKRQQGHKDQVDPQCQFGLQPSSWSQAAAQMVQCGNMSHRYQQRPQAVPQAQTSPRPRWIHRFSYPPIPHNHGLSSSTSVHSATVPELLSFAFSPTFSPCTPLLPYLHHMFGFITVYYYSFI